MSVYFARTGTTVKVLGVFLRRRIQTQADTDRHRQVHASGALMPPTHEPVCVCLCLSVSACVCLCLSESVSVCVCVCLVLCPCLCLNLCLCLCRCLSICLRSPDLSDRGSGGKNRVLILPHRRGAERMVRRPKQEDGQKRKRRGQGARGGAWARRAI